MNTAQFKLTSMIALALTLTACGREFKGDKGDTGATGGQGYGAGILTESIAGLCGARDGVRLTTFQDKNNNGLMDSGETIEAVTSVCNGSNGTNGLNGSNGTNGTSSTVSISTTALSCGSQGGYTLTTTNGAVISSFPICNGATGAQGSQGIQGLQGTAGTVVTPVKFCNSDTSSAFPEYGLYVGGDLYAVYWGSTPASSASQAFLSKLTPGSYMSTGGNNCAFTINSADQVQ